MNFDFLRGLAHLEKLATFCLEAEKLLPISPTSSVGTARKALEYVARLIYALKVGDPSSLNLFEILSDSAFVAFVNDEPTIDAMHTIRKLGNVAAHDGMISFARAQSTLEQLHFVVGDTCIMLGAIKDYPPFVRLSATTPGKPTTQSAAAQKKPAAVAKPEKVVVEPEVIVEYAARMRYTHFNVNKDRDEGER